eukprot:GHVP01055573.1.p1 GENE.GHVP01055573.1~~GHVP01055573.1.p1  ORF type:complete len:114 (+),score=25.26 GHVP01055573.1:114-455(+)
METPKKIKGAPRRKKKDIEENNLKKEANINFVLAPNEKPTWDEIIRCCKNNKFTAEEVLTLFDLDKQFGPCVGLTRLQRFNRAQKLNIACPEYLLGLIEKNSEMSVLEANLPT